LNQPFGAAGTGQVLIGKNSIPLIQAEIQESEFFSFLMKNGRSMPASLFEPSEVQLHSTTLREKLSNGESFLMAKYCISY
jgi:hypothetical protein